MDYFETGFLDQLKDSRVSLGNAEFLYKRAFLEEPEDEEQKKKNRKKLILALSALAGATTLGGIAGTYGAFRNPLKDLVKATKQHASDVSQAEKDYATDKQTAADATDKLYDTPLWDASRDEIVNAWRKANSRAHDTFGRLASLRASVPKMRELNSKDLKNGALWALLGAPVGGAVGALGGHVSNKLNDYAGVTPFAVNVRHDDSTSKKKKKKKSK